MSVKQLSNPSITDSSLNETEFPDPRALIDEMSRWWIRQGGKMHRNRELMFRKDSRSVFRVNWDYGSAPCIMVASKKYIEAFRSSFAEHGLEETGKLELKVELQSLTSLIDLKRAVIFAMKAVGELPPDWPETGTGP